MNVPGASDVVGVTTRLVLVDPADMSVAWVNEAAAEILSGVAGPPTLEHVASMVGVPSLADALQQVAETGEPQHLTSRLIGTGVGTLIITTSAYRLPDGMLLLAAANDLQIKRGNEGSGAQRRPGRRTR